MQEAGQQRPSWRDAISQEDAANLEDGVIAEFQRRRWVTQIGGAGAFKEEPRWHREISLSVLTGRFSPQDAVPLCYRRPFNSRDRVRFFRISDLAAAEYLPLPTPTTSNRHHASIRAPIADDDQALHIAWWARDERVKLQSLAHE